VSDLVASNLFRPQAGSVAHDKHAVHAYVVNQFRLYILLERYLQRPTCMVAHGRTGRTCSLFANPSLWLDVFFSIDAQATMAASTFSKNRCSYR